MTQPTGRPRGRPRKYAEGRRVCLYVESDVLAAARTIARDTGQSVSAQVNAALRCALEKSGLSLLPETPPNVAVQPKLAPRIETRGEERVEHKVAD